MMCTNYPSLVPALTHDIRITKIKTRLTPSKSPKKIPFLDLGRRCHRRHGSPGRYLMRISTEHSSTEPNPESMTELVARTGRHQQRYENGCRLVAGCIPFRYKNCGEADSTESIKIVEVLMINSQSGPGLLFPKGGWENDETDKMAAEREALEEAGVRGVIKKRLGDYDFRSKSHQDAFCPEGSCRAAMFALLVEEELSSWPEQKTRKRSWVRIPDAAEQCRHGWMRKALDVFLEWHSSYASDVEEEYFDVEEAESPER